MGIPAISDIQVFVPKIRLHQEYEEEEEEREQRKDRYGRKAIFTTRMSIDLWNLTLNHTRDQTQLYKNVVYLKMHY